MSKKTILLLVGLLCLCCLLFSCGKDESDVEFTFELSADGAYYILTGATYDTTTDIVIPDTYEDLPVQEIGESAFYGHSRLASVVIPDTVRSIGYRAFNECIALEKVTFSKNLQKV